MTFNKMCWPYATLTCQSRNVLALWLLGPAAHGDLVPMSKRSTHKKTAKMFNRRELEHQYVRLRLLVDAIRKDVGATWYQFTKHELDQDKRFDRALKKLDSVKAF